MQALIEHLQKFVPFSEEEWEYRIKEDDSEFESIYLRPKVGRINSQMARNHAVQYFSYPDYKFQTLRDKFPAGSYEDTAPVMLNE